MSDSESGVQIQLTGWKAVAVIAVFLAVAAFYWRAQSRSLETEGVEAIKSWLQADALRNMPPEVQQAIDNPGENTRQLAEYVESVDQDRIEILSVKARGRGDDVVVRVEVRFAGGEPGGTSELRYLSMGYSLVADSWWVEGETNAVAYYMALF